MVAYTTKRMQNIGISNHIVLVRMSFRGCHDICRVIGHFDAAGCPVNIMRDFGSLT